MKRLLAWPPTNGSFDVKPATRLISALSAGILALALLFAGPAYAAEPYNGQCRTDSGPISNGCLVTVLDGGTLSLSSIFTDSGLTTPLANPFTANSDGRFSFFAADAVYDVKTSGGTPAVTTTTLSGVNLGAGGAHPISTVFGRTGAVVATTGDYEASEVTNAIRGDANNIFGAFYNDFQPISTPGSPATDNVRLYANSDSLWVKLDDGTTVDLAASGGVGSHSLLAAEHTDTVIQTVTRGSLVYGNATPAWDELVIGANLRVLGSDGTDAAWVALTDAHVPDTITLTNITQITNRAVSSTTGDIAASRVDDGAAAATFALFSGAGGTASFRAIVEADISNLVHTVDTDTDTHVNVEENNVSVQTNALALDFLGADFDLSTAVAEVELSIAAALTRDAEWDTIAEIETATSYDFSSASNLDTGTLALARLPFGTANQLIKTNAGGTAQEHATLAAEVGGEISVTFGVGTITLDVVEANLALSAIGGTVTDAQVPNTITIDLATAATALAADPADCAANLFADSINASGTLGCNAIVDADVPNTITIDLATTATTANNLAAGGLDALTEIAGALCGTGEILEDQGASWACIATPAAGGAHNILSTTHTDSTTASVVLGDILIGNVTPAWDRLAGNITSAKQFLTQTGTGAVSAAPVWAAIIDADVPDTITISLAATATALAADPADCAANQFANSIVAAGTLGCAAIVDADVPNTITIDLATVATTANAGDSATAFFSSGILEGTIGGTGSGFTAFTGPTTSLKTFTLPDASSTILTSNAVVTVGQGGTGIATGTSGGVPYFSSTSTIASSAALTANRLLLGGGAGVAPTVVGSLGTTTTLLHGNAAGAPTFGAVVAADLETDLQDMYLNFVLETPATGDSGALQVQVPDACTLQEVACNVRAATSVTVDLFERARATPNTGTTGMLTAPLACTTTGATTTSFTDAALAKDVPLALGITAVSGTPEFVRVHVRCRR